MATRIEKLNRLRIASPCGESWDGMAGAAERRHCAKCDREVFDFARMTPRQIEARIEASGGRLCARLTRGANGLVTLPPPEPPPFWFERRASPVASALFTALLGFGSAATGAALETSPSLAMPTGPSGPLENARTSPNAEGGPAASKVSRIDGVVTDQEGRFLSQATVTIQEPDGGRKFVRLTDRDGRFRFENVAPGTVLIELELEGFSPITFPGISVSAGRETSLEVQMEYQITESVTVGVLAFPYSEPLRQVYGDSELVVIGVVDSTFQIGPENPAEQETEIRVTSVLKGRFAGHSLFVATNRDDEEKPQKPLAPGARVLAFLNADAPGPDGQALYVPTDRLRGPQALSGDELAAYAARLDALERISRRGKPGPEALAEWLVATVEQPLTRKEATGDLSRALAALTEIAEQRELSVEQAAADLEAEAVARQAKGNELDGYAALPRAGAFIGEAEKTRLVRALLATESLAREDLDLYDIVRPWANDKAVEWLTRRFREVEPQDGGVSRTAMGRLAEGLDSDSLKALVKASDDDIESYISSQSEESLNDTDRVEAEIAVRQKELRQRFLDML